MGQSLARAASQKPRGPTTQPTPTPFLSCPPEHILGAQKFSKCVTSFLPFTAFNRSIPYKSARKPESGSARIGMKE